jgi:hypothetical protein
MLTGFVRRAYEGKGRSMCLYEVITGSRGFKPSIVIVPIHNNVVFIRVLEIEIHG